jgi:TetR/AcrR family transcriptional regulator
MRIIKHLTPDVDRLSSEMVEKYTQEAINLILAGVGVEMEDGGVREVRGV